MDTPLSAALELRLFGAPHLLRERQVLHVGTRKALALLALLVTDGAKSRASLATTLWPDVDADAALRSLRQEVFRLRRIGAAPLDVAARRLAPPPQLEVDLLRFRRAVAEGDDTAAVDASAASVFDGLDGLAGGEFDSWLQRTRSLVLPQRQRARSRLAAQLEASGNLAGALALQRQALAEDRCDEAAARAAMRLHVALGDRPAAATLALTLQRALHDELELAPAAETLALAVQLRLPEVSAAASAPAAPAYAQTPAAAPAVPERVPFVGREPERKRIDAAWRAGRRVYLAGVAGVGKSRLAAECASARGAWLRVACMPTDPGVPYASAVRVLRALRESAPGVALPRWVQRELAWLLPELGEGPPPVAGAEAGERLHAAFAAAWQTLAAESFDAIVLDDWHWADQASIELWQRVEDRGAAAIVAYRSAQLGAAAMARVREEVACGAAVAIELEGLAAAETLGLVQAIARTHPGPHFAKALQGTTAGHPFHIIETLRHLAEHGGPRGPSNSSGGGWRGAFDASGDAQLPLPGSVRELVVERVDALGDATRRLLEAASLLGDRIEPGLLEGTAAIDAEAMVDKLEHAEAARLIVADGAQYRFAHDLIRHCLAASLSPARRRFLHARLARRLEACNAEPARVAVHHEQAGETALAIAWRCRAAERAWRAHALAEADAHWRQALADGAEGRDAVAIRFALAEIERYRGGGDALAQALAAAFAAACETDAETRLDARLRQLDHWMSSDSFAQVTAEVDAMAADLAGASAPLRARALRLRALVHHYEGRHDEASRIEDEAIALLEDVPQAQGLRVDLLDAAARTAWAGNRLARSEVLSARAVAAAEVLGDELQLSRALVVRGAAALHARNDRALAADAYRRARVLAHRTGHVPQERAAILNLVKLHADAGEADAAAVLLDEGEALAPGYEHRSAELAFGQSRYYVSYLRGDIAAARAAAERLVALAPLLADQTVRLTSYQLVVDLYLHTGDLDHAARLLDEAGAVDGSVMQPVLTAKRAWLELARSRPQAALALLDTLGPEARAEDHVLIAWIAGAAALTLGDLDGARSHLQAVDIADEQVVDALAMLLVQRLRLAHAQGLVDEPARQRALELLPRMPALEAALLREALANF